ncbi:893_t:CDS:2, partial [Ambispora leptoticha]
HEEEISHKQNRYLFEELSQDNDSEDSYYQITTIDMTTLIDLDLQDGCNIMSINNIISYDKANQIRISEESLLDNNSSNSLLIEEIVDLCTEYFREGHSETFVATQIQNVQNISSSNLDYDLSDILSSFLE